MLWELDRLGATVACDKETHGKVLGVAGEHHSSEFSSSPRGICVSGQHKKYCSRMAELLVLGGASLEYFIDFQQELIYWEHTKPVLQEVHLEV